MKDLFGLCALALLLALPGAVKADATYHPAIGIGTQYAGLGVNLTRATDDDLWVVGGGLVSSSSWAGNRYGAKVSYHRSDLISESGNHALGVGVGPVGNEQSARFHYSNGQVTYSNIRHRAIYGPFLMYNYYPRRMSLGGAHIGVALGYGEGEFRSVTGISINMGYRF